MPYVLTPDEARMATNMLDLNDGMPFAPRVRKNWTLAVEMGNSKKAWDDDVDRQLAFEQFANDYLKKKYKQDVARYEKEARREPLVPVESVSHGSMRDLPQFTDGDNRLVAPKGTALKYAEPIPVYPEAYQNDAEVQRMQMKAGQAPFTQMLVKKYIPIV